MKLKVFRDNYGSSSLVGTIETIPSYEEQFTYDSQYLESEKAAAVSCSLPLRANAFPSNKTRPFFEGLLPEERARQLLAQRLGVKSSSYLKILSQVGFECIGNLTITSEMEKDINPRYDLLTSTELEEIAGNGTTSAPELQAQTRLSLAGAQMKIGLYHAPESDEEDTWYLPSGSAPSTHIVKFSNADFPELLINEHLCLASARACGINTPKAFILPTATPLLCIERFDRTFPQKQAIFASGKVMPIRHHQEDLCQAFGVISQDKYTEDRWGGLSSIATFLREESVDPTGDISELVRIQLFNYLIGNCDNHLKNLSIQYTNNWRTFSLAPAYDLVCTVCFTNLERQMAMRIGLHQNLDRITRDDFVLFGKDLGVAPRLVFQEGRKIADRLGDSLSDAASSLEKTQRKTAKRIVDRILKDAAPRIKMLSIT